MTCSLWILFFVLVTSCESFVVNYSMIIMKSKRRLLTVLRLLRPGVHLVLILVIFRAMVQLRAQTDLIPGVQLRIPQIDLSETMLFALVSAFLFILLGVIQ